MKKLDVVVVSDRIVVHPMKPETRTKGGILLPDTAQEKPQKGIVVAIGEREDGKDMRMSLGDCVMYGKYGGTAVPMNGIEYLLMRENDVFLILPDEGIVLDDQEGGDDSHDAAPSTEEDVTGKGEHEDENFSSDDISL